jgi:transcriptional regulator with PAS, ATPase and Fis domain
MERFIFGSSTKMQEILKKIQKVSNTDLGVLLTGETGVGKERLARMIHNNSLRAKMPFIPIDCGILSSYLLESELFGHERGAFTGAHCRKMGIFEIAQGGTVFIDEIGDMDLRLQPKILRVLQEKTFRRVGGTEEIYVDFRIVTATNCDLMSMVEHNKFRRDLFYRFNGLEVHIPPLRERLADILPLAKYYLNIYNRRYEKNINLAEETKKYLHTYPWFGNVRELMHMMEKIVVTAENNIIRPKHLPVEILEMKNPVNTKSEPIQKLKQVVQQTEKYHILKVLKESGYNKSQAARSLDVALNTLKTKIRLYGIEKDINCD